jgi:hypothetical protein
MSDQYVPPAKPEEDLALRQTVGSSALNELIVAHWIEHRAGCGLYGGRACDCSFIAWFSGRTRVVAVDDCLDHHVFVKQ